MSKETKEQILTEISKWKDEDYDKDWVIFNLENFINALPESEPSLNKEKIMDGLHKFCAKNIDSADLIHLLLAEMREILNAQLESEPLRPVGRYFSPIEELSLMPVKTFWEHQHGKQKTCGEIIEWLSPSEITKRVIEDYMKYLNIDEPDTALQSIFDYLDREKT